MPEHAKIFQLRPQRSREPLWREVLGHRLRTLRLGQGETLAETATRAGISPQYLSEIERGRKEPSSEMIAALAGALDVTLTELTEQVAGDLRQFAAPQALVPQPQPQPLAPQALAA
jgi:transcriptional regulator with XRE-family HTH domain